MGPLFNNTKYSLKGLILKIKLQYFGQLMQRADSEKTLKLGKIEGRRRRGWQRMGWLDGITDSTDMSYSKFSGAVKDSKAWQVAVHGVAESDTTEWMNNKIQIQDLDRWSGFEVSACSGGRVVRWEHLKVLSWWSPLKPVFLEVLYFIHLASFLLLRLSS